MILLSWWTLAVGQECVSEHTAELEELYADGEARRTLRSDSAETALGKDEAAAKTARKLAEKGKLCTADEKWKAAWLMVQADDLDTLTAAYDLAIEAMEAHHPRGPWLVAFTFDRKRTAGGYRQSYGSQTRVDSQGRRCLIQVEPDVTDADRLKYQHPALADRIRQILDLAGFTSDEPTLERLERRGLSCPPVAQTRGADRVAPPK